MYYRPSKIVSKYHNPFVFTTLNFPLSSPNLFEYLLDYASSLQSPPSISSISFFFFLFLRSPAATASCGKLYSPKIVEFLVTVENVLLRAIDFYISGLTRVCNPATTTLNSDLSRIYARLPH
jgi:hypothetical protein